MKKEKLKFFSLRRQLSYGFVAMVCLCVLAFIPSKAQATIQLTADTAATGVVVLATDPVSSAGVLFDSAAGSLPALGGFPAGPVGGFDIVFNGGSSNNPGAAPNALISSSSTFITNNNAFTATIILQLSVQDFTFPAVGPVTLTSTLNGNMQVQNNGLGTEVSFQTYADDTNTLHGAGALTSGLLGPLDIDGFAPGVSWGPLENSVTGPLGSVPFSMTIRSILTLEAGESINYTTTAVLAPVPEPSTVIILGLGLVGLATVTRKKKKVPTATLR